ncbi:MAG: hypothetical protein RSE41_01050 [Clostridia bacterium]
MIQTIHFSTVYNDSVYKSREDFLNNLSNKTNDFLQHINPNDVIDIKHHFNPATREVYETATSTITFNSKDIISKPVATFNKQTPY